MDKITYKFRCGHHRRMLEGEPGFSLRDANTCEWELDLSDMFCPGMPSHLWPAGKRKEYDEEWEKCSKSWHLVEVKGPNVPYGATGTPPQNDNQRDD
jgi:hypothetical protein